MSSNEYADNPAMLTPSQGIYKRGFADGYRNAVQDLTEKYKQISRPWEEGVVPLDELEDVQPGRGVLIDDLGFETHARNVLRRENILTVEELLKYSDGDLRRMKGIGVCTAIGIRMTLKERGHFLRGDEDASERTGT